MPVSATVWLDVSDDGAEVVAVEVVTLWSGLVTGGAANVTPTVTTAAVEQKLETDVHGGGVFC